MNSKKYWAHRSMLDMVDYMGTAEQTAAEIGSAVNAATATISKEIKDIYRGIESFGLSEAEARKVIAAANSPTALGKLKTAAAAVSDPKKKEALLKAIDSAGAYRWRIDRLKTLNKTIDKQCTDLYLSQNKAITSTLKEIAKSSYYHSMFNIQQQAGVAFSFSQFSQELIDKILHFRWAGDSYSSKVWNNTNAVAAKMKDELLVSMLSGRSGAKTARIIADIFGQNMYCARRIVRTESAYVAGAATKASYQEADIEKYRFVATLDTRTSKVCQKLDGKTFPVSEAKPGTNYPPMHPFCRSTTIAVFDDDDLSKLQRRARDKEGKPVLVPADMTYKDWYNQYVLGKPVKPKKAVSAVSATNNLTNQAKSANITQTARVSTTPAVVPAITPASTPLNDPYSQQRKDQALWFTSKNGGATAADKAYRKKSGEVWRSLSQDEKKALNTYTGSSYVGINSDLRAAQGDDVLLASSRRRDAINAMTEAINKSWYDDDIWLQRGCDLRGMDKFFSCSSSDFSLPDDQLLKILQKNDPIEHGFMSTDIAKDTGFDNQDIILNIYAPKKTKMIYAEPFSQHGDGDGLSWDGISTQSSIGYEAEMILQRGTQLRVTKVKRGSNGQLFIDLDVIAQK